MRKATGVAKIPYCLEASILVGARPGTRRRSLRLASVLLGLPAADHDDCEAVLPVLALESSEVGEKRVARPALGIAEDEQYAARACRRARPADRQDPAARKSAPRHPPSILRARSSSRRGDARSPSAFDRRLPLRASGPHAPTATGFAIRCRSSRGRPRVFPFVRILGWSHRHAEGAQGSEAVRL